MILSLAGPNSSQAVAQIESLDVQYGAGVPSEVTIIYERGIKFLQSTQNPDGSFGKQRGMQGDESAGVASLALMAFLSTGDDPNFGRYSNNIRRALRFIIRKQSKKTGCIGGNMYVHGFSMLALSEAYGIVDERLLWAGQKEDSESNLIGESLELAVRLAVDSQKNNRLNAWHYGPGSRQTADTSVAGAVLMGLLAARNAGIKVPNTAIDNAIGYFKSMTEAESGMVAYSGLGAGGDSSARSAIATLVYSIGKRKNIEEYDGVSKFVVKGVQQGTTVSQHPFYTDYYRAQALFQADYKVWEKWNRQMIRTLQSVQLESGQIGKSEHGAAYATSMSLLALALNYRFLPIYER
jgi:hypothetical protein